MIISETNEEAITYKRKSEEFAAPERESNIKWKTGKSS
jgi:hypothetical protein